MILEIKPGRTILWDSVTLMRERLPGGIRREFVQQSYPRIEE